MKTDLKNFFYPKTICIVGASSKEKSIGYEMLNSIYNYRYTGKVLLVNPKAKEILGFKCFKSVLDINEIIDLAIVVVPKKFVSESINQLISKNVKSIILITAGFKETGKLGKLQEERILLKVKDNNCRMVGPNCMGVINTLDEIKLNATFVAEQPKKGGVGFLSQSGALGAAVLNSLRETDIRLAHFISIGNKADVSELDILDFWLSDENIKTITFYLEGFENGLAVINQYKSSRNKKPLIILKAGKTKSGIKAASSHTGALSSNEKITTALLEQFGIIRVNTINEMFNTAKGFEKFPKPKGNRIAVITNAGGPAILAVDKIEESNLILATLSQLTIDRLREIVHPEGSLNNPIDLLPGGSPEVYKKVNDIVLADDNVDAIISIFVEPVMVNAFEVIESVNSLSGEKPIYQVCMPLPEFWQKYGSHSKTKLPVFRNPEDPANIISNILLFEEKKNLRVDFSKIKLKSNKSDKNPFFYNQKKIKALCKLYNLPYTESFILKIEQISKLKELEYPIVIKGLSETVVHKSEMDAVKLDIKNIEESKRAVNEIKDSFKFKGIELNEILIQPFIKVKHELLVGGFRDPTFGPVVMFGSGGKYVEVLNDTNIKSAYLNENDLNEIIFKTKIGQIIKGVRNERGIDITELKHIIKSVAKIMIDNDDVLEIDLNPLICDAENNLHAVDVRIKSN